MNHLKNEESPYLIQHASNPVDWYPWSKKAFEKAKRDNKLIFLSIGYSTCHWCHVMEKESFSRDDVAKVMNEKYVSIKVDREEMPDVDAYFIDFANRVAGNAGWPLNIILTPDLKPVFPFTYIPRESRYGSIGIIELLNSIHELWTNSPEEIFRKVEENEKLTVNKIPKATNYKNENLETLAYNQLKSSFDRSYGGFGRNMKFPSSHIMSFLSNYYNIYKANEALEMAETTAAAIRMGGIYDHVGNGIHRYATDFGWKIPHFEKMLYDQANFIMALSKLYTATSKKQYIDIINEEMEFLRDKMLSPEGGYYSAIDADSEGVEGKYYLWTSGELMRLLGEDYTKFASTFNVREDGNYIEEPKGMSNGKNILYIENEKNYTDRFNKSGFFWLDEVIKQSLGKLKNARERRVPPQTDTKICGDINGFLLYSLSEAFSSTNDKRFLKYAEDLYNFLSNKYVKNGRCVHLIYPSGKTISGYLSDYAFLSMGFFKFGFSTANNQAIDNAKEIADQLYLKLNAERDTIMNENRSAFIGTLNSQEDSSIPSQFAVYERTQLYANMAGQYNELINLSTSETVENITKYPSYFTFRMETEMERKNSILLKGNYNEIDDLIKMRENLFEKGYSSVYFERDDSLKSNTYSLCNSAACVLNGVNFESILNYLKSQKK